MIRDVSVLNVDCEDLSAPYFLMTGDCDLGVRAILNFGSNPLFNPQTAVVRLDAPGCNRRNGCSMAYAGAGNWRRHDLADDAEREVRRRLLRALELLDQCDDRVPGGTDARRDLPERRAPVRRRTGCLAGESGTAAVDAGPVEYVKLATADPGVLDPNTRNTGDPALASVIVTVGIRRPFQVESPLVDPVVLRVASPSGSQNQAFDCDTGINFQNEIADGCQTTYRENYGDWNGDGFKEWRDILCTSYPNGTGLPPPRSRRTPCRTASVSSQGTR